MPTWKPAFKNYRYFLIYIYQIAIKINSPSSISIRTCSIKFFNFLENLSFFRCILSIDLKASLSQSKICTNFIFRVYLHFLFLNIVIKSFIEFLFILFEICDACTGTTFQNYLRKTHRKFGQYLK